MMQCLRFHLPPSGANFGKSNGQRLARDHKRTEVALEQEAHEASEYKTPEQIMAQLAAEMPQGITPERRERGVERGTINNEEEYFYCRQQHSRRRFPSRGRNGSGRGIARGRGIEQNRTEQNKTEQIPRIKNNANNFPKAHHGRGLPCK